MFFCRPQFVRMPNLDKYPKLMGFSRRQFVCNNRFHLYRNGKEITDNQMGRLRASIWRIMAAEKSKSGYDNMTSVTSGRGASPGGGGGGALPL